MRRLGASRSSYPVGLNCLEPSRSDRAQIGKASGMNSGVVQLPRGRVVLALESEPIDPRLQIRDGSANVRFSVRYQHPLLAHTCLKTGLTDRRIRGASLMRRELKIADHAERVVGHRPVSLGAAKPVVPLCQLGQASGGICLPLFVGESRHLLPPSAGGRMSEIRSHANVSSWRF